MKSWPGGGRWWLLETAANVVAMRTETLAHDPLSFEASPTNPLAIAHPITEQVIRSLTNHTRLTHTQFHRERRLQ